ncbi:MAG: hypothetical protein ACP5N1_02355 [Candidatus Woesearchaeota archaeon]
MLNRHNAMIVYLLFIILMLVSTSLVSAATTSSSEWWDSTKYNFASNIPVFGAYINEDSSTMMLFYPVKNWEIEVCTRDLTSSTANHKKGASQNNIFDMRLSTTTVALVASKYNYNSSDEILYNLEWYIQPIDNETIYSIYLVDSSNNKFYLPDYSDKSVAVMEISTKTLPVYYTIDYTYLGIEYHRIDSLINSTLVTEIVDENKAEYD